MWIGFWSAAFPDSDFVLSLIDPLTYLHAHRGITHSVIMLPWWAIGLALLFALVLRRRYSWRAFVVTCALGIGIHILGDIITAFGTTLFAPLFDWRAQIPTTFIIDLYFTGIIVIGLIAAAYWKHSRWPGTIGLATLVAYVGLQAIQLNRAVDVGRAYIASERLDAAEAHAIPQPFSPFNWLVVVEQPDGFHLAHINLEREQPSPAPPEDANWFSRINASYRPVNDARWRRVSRYGNDDPELARTAWNTDGLARYRHFALFPAVVRIDKFPERRCVWFDDLRFTMEGRNGPFRYGACRNTGGAWLVYRLTNESNGAEITERIPE